MTDDSGSQKRLIGAILLLVVAVVVVFVLWQRDEESHHMNVDLDMGNAETVVEPGPPLAGALPEGIGLSESGGAHRSPGGA